MKDEIKEILDRVKKNPHHDFILSNNHTQQLLDYITNLQEENERLNKELDKTRLSELHKEYIINELEKYIGQEYYCFDNESVEFEVAKNILNKLKELKEKSDIDC